MAAIKTIRPVLLTTLILLATFTFVHARTSLVSLPPRQHVSLRMGDTGPILIQEKRILMLKKGINKIDFSWQNVLIDPSSITLAILSNQDKINLLNVSYPPDEAALIWKIYSSMALEQEVMISYLLEDIDGFVSYKAVADPTEQSINLKTFLVLRNFSGENFDKLNVYTNFGIPFITSIHNLETKKILVSQKQEIPIKKVYAWNSLTMPHEPEKSKNAVGIPAGYEFKTKLFKGKARLFLQDSHSYTIFLGEDRAKFTPAGQTATLFIGDSRDIVVTQHRLSTQRTRIKRNTRGNIQVYDEIIKDRITVENLKDKPVILSLTQTINGQWKPVNISMEYNLKDHRTLVFNIDLLSKEKKILDMHYRILNIFNQKFSQYNRVED